MFENYIFTGFGFVTGKYQITNNDIDKAIDDGFFAGLDKERIKHSDKYKAVLKKHPDATPFDYMAEHMMGFRKRFHVVPFPPRQTSFDTAESALDLVVKAISQAIDDSGIDAEDVGAWFVGTATPHEMAPGIAETTKSYFTKIDNQSETITTTSACVGFNINIERALNYLKTHGNVKHVVVAHTEVMSNLLLEEKDFVPFTTFGDGAAAVVLSRVNSDTKEGILNTINYEDLAMVDFLGADRNGNLIMDARRVKTRAIPNIAKTTTELMKKENWNIDDVDIFIPHQTGHAIVHGAAEVLQFPLSKVFQTVQLDFGNLSGASIPASLAWLHQNKKLKKGMKIITAVTGLGGETGGFSYIVPEKVTFISKNNILNGKTALVTGCTGGLGGEISRQLAQKGCRVLMQYNSNDKKAEELLHSLDNKQLKHKIIKADFSKKEEVEKLAVTVKNETNELNYLVHTVAVTGSLNKASEVQDSEMRFVDAVNYRHPALLTELLTSILKETVIFTGSIAQDAQFSGSSAYVSSKRGLFGFAAGYAQINYPKIKCIFYIPGVINGGMTAVLNQAQINASMYAVGQEELIPLTDIANRMVRSLYIPKVPNVRNSYEGVLVVRKDGYKFY
jgi:3-oxoacyl-[acyl-carrier-protein] synthase-3